MSKSHEIYALEQTHTRQRFLPVAESVTANENRRDEADLARWGKKQQLKRNFGFLSTVSLTCTLMITWEGITSGFAPALTNGGPAGLIYSFIFIWAGNVLQALVMAELASMMPLAGGQYNWVSILAPESCSTFLSYITGWITFISWQAGVALASFLGGTMIQGLMVLSLPNSYVPQNWHGTLLFYAILLLSIFVNTLLIRILPHIESLIFVIHIVGFFAILIPLVYYAPHRSAAYVFTTFNNGGGWANKGLSWFVGLGPTMTTFIGLDAGSHIAEEIHNASNVIPRSMLVSVAINGVLGFAMTIALMFCLGDLDTVINTPTKYPFIQVYYDATLSLGGTIAMSSIIIAALIFAAIGLLATACRMTWAFAREGALPFSQYLARVEPRTNLPLFSIGLSAAINCLLALINVGSTVAFNALTSLVIAGFYSSYSIAASVLLYRTLKGEDLQRGPFKIGRLRVPIIVISLIYSFIGIFFSFWPPATNPDPQTMNWSVAVFGGAVIFSLIFWAFHGRKVYKGPIMEIILK